jgi:hypothetical protein
LNKAFIGIYNLKFQLETCVAIGLRTTSFKWNGYHDYGHFNKNDPKISPPMAHTNKKNFKNFLSLWTLVHVIYQPMIETITRPSQNKFWILEVPQEVKLEERS